MKYCSSLFFWHLCFGFGKHFRDHLRRIHVGGAANCVATFSALQISAAIGEITGKVECNRCGNTFQTPDDLNEHIVYKILARSGSIIHQYFVW